MSGNEIGIIILIIVIALVVGYVFYNQTQNVDFTRNAKQIMRQLFIESRSIDNRLNDEKTSENERKNLQTRKTQIMKTLSQFYGYELV